MGVPDWDFDFPTGSDDPPTPVASGTDTGTAVWNQPFEQGPADVMLAGGPSSFGTVGQAGNVWEREETEFDLLNDAPESVRGLRGFYWGLSITDLDLSSSFRNVSLPGREATNSGFRIASIPEPSSLLLLALGGSAFPVRMRPVFSNSMRILSSASAIGISLQFPFLAQIGLTKQL
jgi:hypothetical protein